MTGITQREVGVAWIISCKVCGGTGDEEIWITSGDARILDNRNGDAVGAVKAPFRMTLSSHCSRHGSGWVR